MKSENIEILTFLTAMESRNEFPILKLPQIHISNKCRI